MHQRQRLQLIEHVAAANGWVTVDELVERLEASPATVRRDLALLADAGRVRRVRGAIEPVEGAPTARLLTPSFAQSRVRNWPAKQAIARRAAELCKPGEPVIIHGGTTTYAMAEPIADLGLEVLTNSFPFASRLMAEGNCRVTLPGGEIYRTQNLIVSAFEHDTVLDHFCATKFFTGALAVRGQGVIEGDPLLIKTERKMLKQADRLIVLVDGGKFEAKGSLILCPLGRIDRLITDASAPTAALDMLARQGVEVDVVSGEESVGEA